MKAPHNPKIQKPPEKPQTPNPKNPERTGEFLGVGIGNSLELGAWKLGAFNGYDAASLPICYYRPCCSAIVWPAR